VPRETINLKISQCTSNPTGTDVYKFGDQENAEHVQNTGIERGGGLTNIYEQETTFATAGANSVITTDGQTLQVDPVTGNILLNNFTIGSIAWVGSNSTVPYGISRGKVPSGWQDAVWTSTGTILLLKTYGSRYVTISEFDITTGLITNTRTLTFGVGTLPSNLNHGLSFVRYVDMAYADNQEILVTGVGSVSNLVRESGLTVTSLAGTGLESTFMHRFAANKYIIGNQNATTWYIGDVGAWTLLTDVKWIIIDRHKNTAYSRAICTFDVYKNAANLLTGISYVGYTSGGVYSATETYAGIALGAVTATVTNPITGPGYSECTFTRSDTGATKYYYVAPYSENTTDYYDSGAYGLGFPINSFGTLSQISGNVTSSTPQIRSCMLPSGSTRGVPGFLSAAPGGLGVPLTNVGEFDYYHIPHLDWNDPPTAYRFVKIIYRYAGNYFYIVISKLLNVTISKISNTVYLINSIYPTSIVDTALGKLCMGPNDYNGRNIIKTTAAGATTKIACKVTSPYSNSIDVGDKIVSLAVKITEVYVLAIEAGNSTPETKPADIYLDDVYSFSQFYYSTASGADPNKVNTLYIADTRLPIAMGYSYGDRTALTEIETILTGVGVIGQPDINYGYAGYELGNTIQGLFQSFVLYGNRYLFDGFKIWLASFNGSLYATKTEICPAVGMQFIAAAPTVAYFLSSFDNSIYQFDGGRALIKSHRLNDVRNSADVIEPVLNGIYSVVDNTLLLQTAGSFIHISDGILSQNFKKSNQTSITLYDTQQGAQIANNTMKWRYTFFDIGSTTVVPLIFQSAYFGPKNDFLSKNTEFTLTFYSPSRALAQIILGCVSYDGDAYVTQTETLTIQPSDWNGLGIFICRIQPKTQLCLAASVAAVCTTKIILTNITVEYEESVSVAPRNSRSR
jgi:hypothetical protein